MGGWQVGMEVVVWLVGRECLQKLWIEMWVGIFIQQFAEFECVEHGDGTGTRLWHG